MVSPDVHCAHPPHRQLSASRETAGRLPISNLQRPTPVRARRSSGGQTPREKKPRHLGGKCFRISFISRALNQARAVMWNKRKELPRAFQQGQKQPCAKLSLSRGATGPGCWDKGRDGRGAQIEREDAFCFLTIFS